MRGISTLILPVFLFISSFILGQDTVKVSTLAGLENTAEKLYNSGISKFAAKDLNGAISDFTQAISINPNFFKAFYNRGIVKYELKDTYGAIADYTQAITLSHDSCEDCYFSRAQAE